MAWGRGSPPCPAPGRTWWCGGKPASSTMPPGLSAESDRHLIKPAVIPVAARVCPNVSAGGVGNRPDRRVGGCHHRTVHNGFDLGGGLDALDVVPGAVVQARAADGVVPAS